MLNVDPFLLQRVLCNKYLWATYYFFSRFPGITTLREFSPPSLLFSILHDRTLCVADLQFLTFPRLAHSVQPLFLRKSSRPSHILLIFFCLILFCGVSSPPHHTVYVWILGIFGYFVVYKTRHLRHSCHIIFFRSSPASHLVVVTRSTRSKCLRFN